MRLLFFIITLCFAIPSMAGDIMDTRTYGKDAPAKIYLFTSLACPHCAEFHRNILPDIQKKYLDTHLGQVVIIDMLMNKQNLMGAMLLRCASKDQVNRIEDNLYDNQKKWVYGDEDQARSYLAEVALDNGISAGDFETCLNNKELEKTIATEQERMARLYNIAHMPTVLIRQNEKISSWEGADKDLVMTGLSDFFK